MINSLAEWGRWSDIPTQMGCWEGAPTQMDGWEARLYPNWSEATSAEMNKGLNRSLTAPVVSKIIFYLFIHITPKATIH